MRLTLVAGFMAVAGFAGWANPAGAGFLSATGPVIAILDGGLFVGEAVGHLDGSGTISIHSHSIPEVTCRGQFTSSAELGGTGNMQCSDGMTATIQFQRLSVFRGYGTGSTSRGPMSFTYGLHPNETEHYLKLPRGKTLRLDGKELELVDDVPSSPARNPGKGPIAPAPVAAPDGPLGAATSVVVAGLEQD